VTVFIVQAPEMSDFSNETPKCGAWERANMGTDSRLGTDVSVSRFSSLL
jgi:hypothetical protein